MLEMYWLKTVLLEEMKSPVGVLCVCETRKTSSFSERGLRISDLNLDQCLLNLWSSKDGAANKQGAQPKNKATESAQKAADMAYPLRT